MTRLLRLSLLALLLAPACAFFRQLPATRFNSYLTSLVSFWNLEEASGATRLDSYGSNTLADHNTVTQTTGKIRNAAAFVAASSQYLSVANNPSVTVSGSWSVTAWVNTTSYPAAGDVVLADWNGAGTDRSFFVTLVGTSGKLRCSIRNAADGATVSESSTAVVATGSFQFVACVYDATNQTLASSINAAAAESVAATTGIRAIVSAPLTVGALADPTGFMDGTIDAVGLWKRVLTASEITHLYNAGAGMQYRISLLSEAPGVRLAEAFYQRMGTPAHGVALPLAR